MSNANNTPNNPHGFPNRCFICDAPCTGTYCENCQEVHKAPEAAKKPTLHLLICLPTDWESRVESGSRIVKCEDCGRNVWVSDETAMLKQDKGDEAKVVCIPCGKKRGVKI